MTGGRSLDILAETGDGRRVAIENQYGVADHDHLTRGLAYAVATEAKALVVIAEHHRDEFVSVVNYLNEVGGVAGDLGILVWLVKVRPVRRQGDTIWSPEFVVQARPNNWESAIRREAGPLLGSLEEFYAKAGQETSGDWAERARRIVEGCLALGMRESHNAKQTVALYASFPDRPGGLNVLQVWTTGYFAICRGYLRDHSGAFRILSRSKRSTVRSDDASPGRRGPRSSISSRLGSPIRKPSSSSPNGSWTSLGRRRATNRCEAVMAVAQ